MTYNESLPKISIVTPVFNQVEYLEETIKSVLDQNYPNLEYIIIDGGSTDGTVDIIKRYSDRLAYWVSEPDNGMYEAIQKGFDRSTGEIMAWIGSDDMYHRKSLFTVAEIFSTFDYVNWIVGESSVYDKIGRTLYVEHSIAYTKFDYYTSDLSTFLQQESCFWRRCLWIEIGSSMNTKLKYAGDFDLWLRFIEIDRVYVVNALIGGFRICGGNQLSQNHMDDYCDECRLCLSNVVISENDKKMIERFLKLKKIINMVKKTMHVDCKRILKRFRRRNFNDSQDIRYNFDSNTFYLCESKHEIND